MRTADILIVAGLLAASACNKQSEASKESTSAPSANPGPAAVVPASQQTITIEVGANGFEPSKVSLHKGETATLRFKRVTDDTCAKKVVFPELKLEKDLPLNQSVDVSVPTDTAREVGFQCGMGMYKSAVVIR